MLLLPITRTTQPQQPVPVIRQQGISGVWMPGAGDILALRDGGRPSGFNKIGRCYILTNSTTERIGLHSNSDFIPTSGGFSMLVSLVYGANLGTGQGVGIRSLGGALTNRASIFLGTSNNIFFDYGGATDGATRVIASTSTTSGTVANVLATTGPRGMEIWLNGKLLASHSGNPTRTVTASYEFAAGDLYVGTSGNTTYNLISTWNTQIPSNFARSLSENPWQIFTPQPRKLWVVPASGGLFTQNISGSLSFSGLQIKQNNKVSSGILNTSGESVKQTNKITNGNLSFTGSLIKLANLIFLSSLSFNGEILKLTSKVLDGSLNFIGDFIKTINKVLSGDLSFSGALITLKTFLILLIGDLSFVGDSIKTTHKVSDGSLGFVGNIIKSTNKALSGSLSFSGTVSLIKSFLMLLTGSLSFNGDTFKVSNKLLVGNLSFIGNQLKSITKIINGILSFVGNLSSTRNIVMLLTGLLSFSGNSVKQTNKNIDGTLSFNGLILKLISKLLSGLLSLSGICIKQINKLLYGSLSFIGSIISLLVSIFTPSIDRIYSVGAEQRSYTMLLESRLYSMPLESRNYIL